MELKSCPFCKSPEMVVVKTRKGHAMQEPMFAIWHKPRGKCILSNMKIYSGSSEERAIINWNNRSPIAQQTEGGS